MEQYDLVNEKDDVIGVTDKEESHRNGLLHRAVAIYVFTPDGKIYIQEHIKSGGKYDHSVGGHVDKGESYDDAAKREGIEELGLTDKLEKLSVFYSDERFGGSNIRHMFGLYECHPSDKWKFHENEEVKNIFPMTIEEVVTLMNKEPSKFTGGFINTMKEFLKIKKIPLKLNL